MRTQNIMKQIKILLKMSFRNVFYIYICTWPNVYFLLRRFAFIYLISEMMTFQRIYGHEGSSRRRRWKWRFMVVQRLCQSPSFPRSPANIKGFSRAHAARQHVTAAQMARVLHCDVKVWTQKVNLLHNTRRTNAKEERRGVGTRPYKVLMKWKNTHAHHVFVF